MRKYAIKKSYTFEVTYIVVAEDEAEAEAIVNKDCGLSLGNIHTTNNQHVQDWDAPCSYTKDELISLERITMED